MKIKLRGLLLIGTLMLIAAFFTSCATECNGSDGGSGTLGGSSILGDDNGGLDSGSGGLDSGNGGLESFELTFGAATTANTFVLNSNTLANIGGEDAHNKTANIKVMAKDSKNTAAYYIMHKIEFNDADVAAIAAASSLNIEDSIINLLTKGVDSSNLSLVPAGAASKLAGTSTDAVTVKCTVTPGFAVDGAVNCKYTGTTAYGPVSIASVDDVNLALLQNAVTPQALNFYVAEFSNEAVQTTAFTNLVASITIANTTAEIIQKLNAYAKDAKKVTLTLTANISRLN